MAGVFALGGEVDEELEEDAALVEVDAIVLEVIEGVCGEVDELGGWWRDVVVFSRTILLLLLLPEEVELDGEVVMDGFELVEEEGLVWEGGSEAVPMAVGVAALVLHPDEFVVFSFVGLRAEVLFVAWEGGGEHLDGR